VNTGATPSVDYTWSFSPLTEGNYDRLASMA
jgi:hypothetical protein